LPPEPPKEHKITLNLQQVNPVPTPTNIPKVKADPLPIKKDVRKQKHLDTRKKTFARQSEKENNSSKTEVIPTPSKQIVKKEKPKKVKEITKRIRKKPVYKKPKRTKVKTRPSKDPLANILMGSGSSLFSKKSPSSQVNNYSEKMIKSLYGSEFNTFNPTQKKFIRRNLSTIHKITQRTLTRNGYPEVARRTGQQGTNVVSFYLHSNGDISGLKLKRPIGYSSLDENTLKVIRIAYKNYPLPNKKTKIIFYVNYRIY